MLDWFDECATGINRLVEGNVMRLTWRDLDAWRNTNGITVYPHEFAILKAMDLAYCEAMEGELSHAKAVAADEAEQARSNARSGR